MKRLRRSRIYIDLYLRFVFAIYLQVHFARDPQHFSLITMNIDNSNRQSTTNQDIQFSSTYNPQDVFELSEFQPHVNHGWLQNNSTYPSKYRTFSTSAPLSVGFFLQTSSSTLNLNTCILMDTTRRLKLIKGQLTNQMYHTRYASPFACTYLYLMPFSMNL